ncbi:MAG: hypothetical protein IKZ86_06420 [Spirochaetaceae bacterium]|nr:hypothetical protein [Spirochaetaceae bacterium]
MNELNNFSQYIDIYINEEKTDYAILLNAPWGAGKTHFVKKYCNNKSDSESQNYDSNNYVYFSLKGISDIEQLINSINLRILLKFKTEQKNCIGEFIENLDFDKFIDLFNNRRLSSLYKSVSLLSSAAISSYIDNYLIKLDNKVILFLDDLERTSEKINIEDLLGELDTQFIGKGIKIIYIANEEEFTHNHKESYNKNKEKYIRRTYTFNPNKSDVFSDFLQEFSLEQEQNDLFDILLSSFSDNPPNLRTVKYCCTLYKELLKASNEFPSTNTYQSVLILLPTICEYAKFITINNISKEAFISVCNSNHDFIRNYLAALNIPQMEERNKNENTDNEESDEIKCKEFFDSYSQDNSITLYTNKFLIDFIFDGYLNTFELEKFLRIEIQKEDPLNILIYHLYDYNFDDIKANVYKVYKNIINEEYSIDELNLLINNFFPLAIRILQLKDVTNDYAIIEEQIKKEISNKNSNEFKQKITKKINDIIVEKIADSIFSKKSEGALFRVFEYKTINNYYEFPKFTKEFNIKIEEKYNAFIVERNKQYTDGLFDAIKTATYTSEIFRQIDEHKIFSMLKEANKFEEIPNLPNKSIQFLIKFINSKILGLGNAYQFYMAEIPILEELQKLINEKIDYQNPDFIKTDLLKELDKTISAAIKHINDSKKYY